jgi:glycerol-3-phosphate acyltransferase PlsY
MFAHILGLALENAALRLFSRSAGIESGDSSPHSTLLPVLEQAAFLLAPAWEERGLWSAAKRRRFGFPAERGERLNAPFGTAPPQHVGKDPRPGPGERAMPLPPAAIWVLGGLLSYLLGAVPFGLIAGLALKGVDIREHGSRNVGATNALRVLGKPIGIAVHVLDIAKGFVPSFALARLFAGGNGDAVAALGIAYGSAAILGHVFPVYLKFHGGKGMATSLGAFLGLAWLPTLLGALVWLAVRAATRYVSVASMTAVAAIPVAMTLVPDPANLGLRTWCKLEYIVFGALVALLVIIRHKSNIVRLLQGTEHRAGETERNEG